MSVTHTFSDGGEGPQYLGALRQGPVSPPRRSPPQPGRARHLSLPAFGLCAAVDDPPGDVWERQSHMDAKRRTWRSILQGSRGGPRGDRNDVVAHPAFWTAHAGTGKNAHGVSSL